MYRFSRYDDEEKRENCKDAIELIKKDDLEGFLKDKQYKKIKAETTVSAKLDDVFNYLDERSIGFMHVAAYYDAINIFMYLAENEGISVLQENAKNYNPLHYACFRDSIEVASYILNKKPNAPKTVTPTEYQYIYFAVVGRSPDILELLVRGGANPSSNENKVGDPIKIASSSRQADLLKILLVNYKPETNPQSMSPIMYAINYQFNDVIPLLIESGCRADEIVGGQKALAVECKCAIQDLGLVKTLCSLSREVDMPDDFRGSAAIHWICLTSNPELVKIVLSYNIDVNRVDERGQYGPELLNEYKLDENLEILDMLYQRGFDVNNINPITKAPVLSTFCGWIRPPIKIIAWFLNHGAKIATVPFKQNGQTLKAFMMKMLKIRNGLKEYGIDIEKIEE